MFCANPDCPDLKLYGVRGEYVAGIHTCPKCEAPLVDELPPEPAPPEEDANTQEGPPLLGDDEHLELVFAAGDPSLVAIAKSILEEANIRYFAFNEQVQDLIGGGRLGGKFNPVTGPVEFRVPRDQAELARALLTEVDGPAETC